MLIVALALCLIRLTVGLNDAYGSGIVDSDTAFGARIPPSMTQPAQLLGRANRDNLLGHQATTQEVIGYWNEDIASPATCVAYNTASSIVSGGSRYWDCCETFCTVYPTACTGYDDHEFSSILPKVYNSILYCGYSSVSRYCQRGYLIGENDEIFTRNVCGSFRWTTPTIYRNAIASSTTSSTSIRTSSSTASSIRTSTAPSTTSDARSRTSTSPSNSPAVVSPTTNTDAATGTTAPSRSTNTGAIAGGAIGGVAALGLIAAGTAVLIRRRRKQQSLTASTSIPRYEPEQEPKQGRY